MILGEHIKQLIEQKGLNKAEFARKISMSPQSLNGLFKRESIESKNLIKIAAALDVPVASFFPGESLSIAPKRTEFIPVFLNNNREGVIPIVNKKAAAGLPAHVNDVEYLQDLPYIQHPHFTDAQYICIQVRGDSMVPTLQEDDYVIARYVEDFNLLRQDSVYVVILADGVLVKRMDLREFKQGSLMLKSDNEEYEPLHFLENEILQVWEVRLRMTADFDQADKNVQTRLEALENALFELRNKIS